MLSGECCDKCWSELTVYDLEKKSCGNCGYTWDVKIPFWYRAAGKIPFWVVVLFLFLILVLIRL